MSDFTDALREGFLLPRAKDAPLTEEQTSWIDKHVNELFQHSKLHLYHLGDKYDEGHRTRGYPGSYEQVYDKCIEQSGNSAERYKADREINPALEGKYYITPPHIQMFSGAFSADIAFGRMHNDHAKNAAYNTTIPELDKDTRVVIKTVEEAAALPVFKGARKELMELTDINRPVLDSYHDYSRPKDEKRVILIYDNEGELKRAFGATIELNFKRDFGNKEETKIYEKFRKGEMDQAEWEKQLADLNFHHEHGRTAENIRLHMHKTYNPKLQTIEDVSEKRLDLPLDQGKPFGREFQDGHEVLPNYRDRAFVPSPKQAQQFIDKVNDANLVQNQQRPAGISDEVLTAAVQAARKKAPMNIPLVANQMRNTELVI